MSTSYLFSIVIPTYNRSHLLPYALRSIVEHQLYNDYEIIVSDNSSTDNTPKVVERYRSEKVKYVRTPKHLPMSDHWEFALQHASGEYITYLCDDDAWRPDVLSMVEKVIRERRSQLIAMFRGRYHAHNSHWEEWRNSLSVIPFTGQIFELESKPTLQRLFKYQESMRMPKMFNSFCHRDIIHSARRKWGRIFMGWCPDYSFPAIILNEVERWTLIDIPLWLRYEGPESIGSGAVSRSKAFVQYLSDWRQTGRERWFEYVPLELFVDVNFSVETLLAVKNMAPEKFSDIDIDWENYFIACWHRLLLQQASGVDVEEDKKSFLEVLDLQPKEIKRRVLSVIKGIIYDSKYKTYIRKTFITPLRLRLRNYKAAFLPWNYLRNTWMRLKGMYPGVRVRGDIAGFNDILECALKLKNIVGR